MSETPNVVQVTLVWGEDQYILQHPGNRAWLRIYAKLFEKKHDLDGFLSWCCEEVIHPLKGEKLTLETISPARVMSWIALLQTFFVAGELHPDFEWRDYSGSGYSIGKKEGDDEEEVLVSGQGGEELDVLAAGGAGDNQPGEGGSDDPA